MANASGRFQRTSSWAHPGWSTLNVDDITLENYRYLVTAHIGPRFGHQAVGKIHSSDVNEWVAELYGCGYEHSTVQGILGLLGRILGDAVDDGIIPANPVRHRRHRGKRALHIPRGVHQSIVDRRVQERRTAKLTDGKPTDPGIWEGSFASPVNRNWPRRPHVLTFGFGEATAESLRGMATKAAFLAKKNLEDKEALSRMLTTLLNTLVASAPAGALVVPDGLPGFERIPVDYVE